MLDGGPAVPENGNGIGVRCGTANPRPPRDTTLISAGIDLVDLERFRLAVHRTRGRILERVLAPEERAEIRNLPVEQQVDAAARVFGVKEGAIKALGGMPSGASFTDIAMPSSSGASPWPLDARGTFGRRAQELGVDLYAGGGDLPGQQGLALAWVFAVSSGRSGG